MNAPRNRHRDFDRPHLSHSRISRYLTCPEQYRLYYIEGLRPRVPSANLIFGRMIHEALAQEFRGQADAVTWFMQQWDTVLSLALTYSYHDSWEILRAKGHILLSRFLREELGRAAWPRYSSRRRSTGGSVRRSSPRPAPSPRNSDFVAGRATAAPSAGASHGGLVILSQGDTIAANRMDDSLARGSWRYDWGRHVFERARIAAFRGDRDRAVALLRGLRACERGVASGPSD